MGRKKKNAAKRNQGQNRRKRSVSTDTTNNVTRVKDKSDLDSSCAPFGLTNLGNTCYLNSVLQVLSRTPSLVHLLHPKLNDRSTWRGLHIDQLVSKHSPEEDNVTEDEVDDDLTNGYDEDEEASNSKRMPNVALVPAQELTSAFFELMKEMQTPRTPSKRVITPSRLRKALAKKSRQFCDRDEQDSHELLRTLIDLIRSDEIRRHRLAVYDWLKIPREPAKQNNVDDDTKALVKAHSASCNFTTVDSLFSGYLLSSITCHECGNTTQILEQMFDLSVPVSEAKLPHECIKKQYSTVANKSNNNSNGGGRVSKASPLPRVDSNELDPLDSAHSKSDDSTRANADLDDSDGRLSDFLGDVDLPDSADIEDAQDTEDEQDVSRDDDIPLAPVDDLKDSIDRLTLESPPLHCELPSSMYPPSVPAAPNDSTCIASTNGHDIETTSDSPCNKSLIKWSLRTVGQVNVRKSESKNGGNASTLEACLSAFTHPELLTGSNKLFCENCTKLAKEKNIHQKQGHCTSTGAAASASAGNSSKKKTTASNDKQVKVYSNASKHFLIAYPPVILTIHLKRFHVEGYGNVNLRKINRHVNFDLELDLSPWVSQVYSSIGEFLGVDEKSTHSTLKYRLYGLVEHSGTLRGGHYTAKVRVDTNCKGKKVTSNHSKYLRMRPFVPSFDTFLKQLDIDTLSINTATTVQQNGQSGDVSVVSTQDNAIDNMLTVSNDDGNSSTNSLLNNETNDPAHADAHADADVHADADAPASSESNVPSTGKSQWFHCCDSNVRAVTLDEVISSQAYLLFYERI